jgi:hypothetical protein
MRKVAFIKRSGLGTGGTEKWLQHAAIALSRNGYSIDYYYSNENIDAHRLKLMSASDVILKPFCISNASAIAPYDWIDTNFWDVFNQENYDLIQTAKYGPKEYPFYLLTKPFCEKVAFATNVDFSSNRLYTITPSPWLMKQWIKSGGSPSSVTSIHVPVSEPTTTLDLRDELNISYQTTVAGFHQRPDDNIFSPIPLAAFSLLNAKNKIFLIMGGSPKYKFQARKLNLKNVIFVPHSGSEKRVSKFLNTLDFFAHGRKDGETFGTVFAEAQMHGLACLSHRSHLYNAHIETIGDSGIVANNLFDYTWHLNSFYSRPTTRLLYSKNSRYNGYSRFSLDAFQVQILQLYDVLFDHLTAK